MNEVKAVDALPPVDPLCAVSSEGNGIGVIGEVWGCMNEVVRSEIVFHSFYFFSTHFFRLILCTAQCH